MYNTYTIGELAKILDVTAETIRYYERKNIIQPIKNKESGYRYYTTWDLHMIIRARCYLGFGFSIEEVADLLQKEKLEDIDAILAKQEDVLQQNIIYQMNLLRKLRLNRSLINDKENQQKQFCIQTRPGIYRIDTQKCYTLDLTNQERNELKKFCEYIPFVFSTALFPKNYIEEKNKDFYFGIGIEEEYAQLFDVKENDYVHYYPPQTCLYMSFPSRSSQFLTYEVLEPAFNYMEENNLQLNGDVITQIVSMWKPEEEYFNLHNIWIPIN
ncbi:MAG: MerR family transcriptional regulator [Erysipelotrichaceae bacterium]|nr:MerR family transcriptional regulator [Erysipelotrichaceae bacterium]